MCCITPTPTPHQSSHQFGLAPLRRFQGRHHCRACNIYATTPSGKAHDEIYEQLARDAETTARLAHEFHDLDAVKVLMQPNNCPSSPLPKWKMPPYPLARTQCTPLLRILTSPVLTSIVSKTSVTTTRSGKFFAVLALLGSMVFARRWNGTHCTRLASLQHTRLLIVCFADAKLDHGTSRRIWSVLMETLEHSTEELPDSVHVPCR